MPNLPELTKLADENDHNLTGPLTHDHVKTLAGEWFPAVLFHPRERFHPVALQRLFTEPNEQFQAFDADKKQRFQIRLPFGLAPDGAPIVERFDPPVVFTRLPAFESRVFGAGAAARGGLEQLDVDAETFYTHGFSRDKSIEFFGATRTVFGANTLTDQALAEGDSWEPRHPVVVHAEMRMLLETLKHELQLDRLGADSPLIRNRRPPIDTVWTGFGVEDLFFRVNKSGSGPSLDSLIPRSQRRAILAALIAAHETDPNDQQAQREVLAQVPASVIFSEGAWAVVSRFAFLEFYLHYSYNDWKEYTPYPANEHEGDNEGFCLVFERPLLEQFAADDKNAQDIPPHTLITIAHEELSELDEVKRLPRNKDGVRSHLLVYVGLGSHGTYPTNDEHDVIDPEDIFTDVFGQLPTAAQVLAALDPVNFAMALVLAAIAEHFVDVEDQTSDKGISIGPGEPDVANRSYPKEIVVTPLSAFRSGDNLYTAANRERLALRGYPGKWGGHSGDHDKSSPWKNRTARFLRAFLDNGQFDEPMLG
jgi:hypothetical protein